MKNKENRLKFLLITNKYSAYRSRTHGNVSLRFCIVSLAAVDNIDKFTWIPFKFKVVSQKLYN